MNSEEDNQVEEFELSYSVDEEENLFGEPPSSDVEEQVEEESFEQIGQDLENEIRKESTFSRNNVHSFLDMRNVIERLNQFGSKLQILYDMTNQNKLLSGKALKLLQDQGMTQMNLFDKRLCSIENRTKHLTSQTKRIEDLESELDRIERKNARRIEDLEAQIDSLKNRNNMLEKDKEINIIATSVNIQTPNATTTSGRKRRLNNTKDNLALVPSNKRNRKEPDSDIVEPPQDETTDEEDDDEESSIDFTEFYKAFVEFNKKTQRFSDEKPIPNKKFWTDVEKILTDIGFDATTCTYKKDLFDYVNTEYGQKYWSRSKGHVVVSKEFFSLDVKDKRS